MQPEPTKSVRAAGIFLLLRENGNLQFLLLEHADRWDLPKGHCDAGESYLQTALRELEEETGIRPDQIEIDQDFSFEICYPVRYYKPKVRNYNKRVRYFLGILITKPTICLTEHIAAHWIDWNPARKIQAKTIDPLIAEIAKHIAKGTTSSSYDSHD